MYNKIKLVWRFLLIIIHSHWNIPTQHIFLVCERVYCVAGKLIIMFVCLYVCRSVCVRMCTWVHVEPKLLWLIDMCVCVTARACAFIPMSIGIQRYVSMQELVIVVVAVVPKHASVSNFRHNHFILFLFIKILCLSIWIVILIHTIVCVNMRWLLFYLFMYVWIDWFCMYIY